MCLLMYSRVLVKWRIRKKAAAMDFKEAVNNLDEDQLDGFISGVKGKLFEIKYTDYLNDGG